MIVVSDLFWGVLLDNFAWPKSRLERVAYIDGVAASDDLSVATTLVFPNAKLYERHFEVTAEAMSQAGRHFRAYHLQRVAQVHTHPGDWVDHSQYDDEMAYSQHLGAVSIVMPNHARSRPALSNCGVHVREEQGWRMLAQSEISSYISLVPGLLDFRRKDS